MPATADIASGLAAIGAAAAAISARASTRNVALSNRPYVYGERGYSSSEQSYAVRLHNDGAGVAREVRFRINGDETDPTDWSDPVRGMPPGATTPPPEEDGFLVEPPRTAEGLSTDWFIETEYSDATGTRWRLRNDRSDARRSAVVRRVRTRRYQLWLLNPHD